MSTRTLTVVVPSLWSAHLSVTPMSTRTLTVVVPSLWSSHLSVTPMSTRTLTVIVPSLWSAHFVLISCCSVSCSKLKMIFVLYER
jgi:uncharacterized integral membrane protein